MMSQICCMFKTWILKDALQLGGHKFSGELSAPVCCILKL